MLYLLDDARRETINLARMHMLGEVFEGNNYFCSNDVANLSIRGSQMQTAFKFTYEVLRDAMEAFYQVYASQGARSQTVWRSRGVIKTKLNIEPGHKMRRTVAIGNLEAVTGQESGVQTARSLNTVS